MVNRGRSGACQTCKERRVKCDEARPGCQRCARGARKCAGYPPASAKVRFKDQTQRFSRVALQSRQDAALAKLRGPDHRAPAAAAAAPRPSYSLPTASQNAAAFFDVLLGDAGRSTHSWRGFFELLGPALSSQRQDSALALVVSAVAEAFLALWQGGAKAFQTPRPSFNRAVLRLRTATLDADEKRHPATVLAVLALQFHENLAALYAHRRATRYHHGGAEALLRLAEADDKGEEAAQGACIARYVASAEVSSATREGRPVPTSAVRWLDSGGSAALPPTPSSTLDALGAAVADLQFSYNESSAKGEFPSSEEEATAWRERVDELAQRLRVWAETVPRSCRPVRLHSGRDFDASIPAYQDVCDVYSSCHIAAMWNLWRGYRLMLLKLQVPLLLGRGSWAQSPGPGQPADSSESYKQDAQGIVDSICYSVPFCLGNRSTPSSVRDFSDPGIHFPSVHCLPDGDWRRLQSQGQPMSKRQHQYHALVQGPWHLMGPLSRLLTLFSETHGWFVTGALRTGQREWICEQFLRLNVLQLLDMDFLPDQSRDRSVIQVAEELAKFVQRGLSLTSGL